MAGKYVRVRVKATNTAGASAFVSSEVVGPVTLPNAYENQVVSDGAVAYYRMNEASGTALKARVGNDGSYVGTPELNHAPPAGPALGTGVYFQYNGNATFPTPSVLDSRSETLETWAYVTDNKHGSMAMVGGANSATSNGGYGVGMGGDYWRESSSTGSPQLIVLFEGVAWFQTGYYLSVGWHHIVLVISATGTPTVYVDGQQRWSSTNAAATAPTAGANSTIGGFIVGGPTSNGEDRRYFGVIDETAVYNRQLTASEISTHYTLGRG
jgi:hypothetical protein